MTAVPSGQRKAIRSGRISFGKVPDGNGGWDHLYNINSDPPLPLIVASRMLAQALRQHALPIIIRDKKLARPFEVLWWAQQNWWAVVMAIIIAYAISQRYGVTFEQVSPRKMRLFYANEATVSFRHRPWRRRVAHFRLRG